MRESDIVHEAGDYWVGRDRGCGAYVIYKNEPTHSVSVGAFGLNSDGLSIAIARANYLATRVKVKSGGSV